MTADSFLAPLLSPLLGGALIGLSATLMLLLNGRVTGVSGILNRFLTSPLDRGWRASFLAGLLVGGSLLRFLLPSSLAETPERSWAWIICAGFLVGFGTVLGSGCTSGHGICGLSRLSLRSLVATLVFMAFGILSATLFRILILEVR